MTPDAIRTDVAHSARMYDFLLGGKDNFEVDRQAVAQLLVASPQIRDLARDNRRFLRRAVRYLAGERGIRQFLDIGTGLPTSLNLHEVAQGVAPEAHVVYVDNDPLVLVHARALLASAPEGRTAYVEADLREPATILGAAELRDTLDLDRPIALSLLAILHFFTAEADPYGIVATLVDALPSGSALVISHATSDFLTEEMRRTAEIYQRQGIAGTARSHDEVLRFFDGLGLVDPGLVLVNDWRPDGESAPDAPRGIYGGVAFKP
ncbi:SAM-dependent methyltransferase [Cryptosporangium phraense]|uniref:SAM-dependent methyltransferase n=1 Tax=Cryptosporangium phraense TaxID=2593070 RepID=A0A545AQ99_9ACTN|nr:SAM-dependent methyltransferase [Cryptosporangium phraense]TQS43484.1 SAM-dependent methyltransferase [Cryptosporangium phraense]